MRTLLILFFVALATALAQADDAQKKPIPNAKAQTESLVLVKDIFKTEYAAKSADKRALLARTLLKQGLETTNDAAGQFVLLREAAEISATLGDTETALSAVNELVTRFQVDPADEKGAILERLATSAKSADAQKLIAEEAIKLVNLALAGDNFERALAQLTLAEKLAIKAKDLPTITTIRKRKEEVAAAKIRFAKLAKFADTLKQNPDDAEANLEVGRYECFVKNDWPAGLPRLAKSNDSALKSLAGKSLAKPKDPLAQAEIAGGWWDVAEKLTATAERDATRRYSAEWYRTAAPGLNGLLKSIAEKRVAEAEKSPAGTPAAIAKRTIDLIPLIDLSKDVLHGQWRIEKGALVCDTKSFVPKVQIPYQPPEEYDFGVTFTQPKLRNGISLIMPNKHGGSFFWAVGRGRGTEYGLSSVSDSLKLPAPLVIQPNTVHQTVVQVRREGVRVYCDGKPLVELKTDFSDLKSDNWRTIKDPTLLAVACDDLTVFLSVQVIEISGPGKKTR